MTHDPILQKFKVIRFYDIYSEIALNLKFLNVNLKFLNVNLKS